MMTPPRIQVPWAEKIEGPGILTLGMVSMSVPLCRSIWIIVTKDERFLISKQHGTVASSSPDLATFFASEEEAQDYLAHLEVRNAANLKLFPLFEWVMRLIQRRRIGKAEDAGGDPAETIPQ